MRRQVGTEANPRKGAIGAAVCSPPKKHTGPRLPQPAAPLPAAQSTVSAAPPPERTPEEKALLRAWAERLLEFPRSTLPQGPGKAARPMCGAGPDQELWLAKIAHALGTDDPNLIAHLIHQMAGCLWKAEADLERSVNLLVATVAGIAPRDQLEALLAVQMAATHNAALELLRRALLPEQTADGVNLGVHRATQLLRTFTAQVEALSRYRGGGRQTVRVEHVHVNPGGQAIVGAVQHTPSQVGEGGRDEAPE
jgi:hypothetical protein